MQSKEKNGMIFIRLFPDENIYDQLRIACQQHNVKAAVMISGIGQLKRAKLGFFREKDDYMPEEFNSPLELLSLAGNIIQQDGEYLFHFHAVLGDSKKRAIGGHLIDGTVEITNEIVLMKSDIALERRPEERTGLKGIYLD
ncbi:MAG: DNA-binding protein [Candidatus Thermoplasmatota archaeon]|jgi:hypothetical protein|nr:DNA-binding protein [Candidatus Thermoplasmatota archaeon]